MSLCHDLSCFACKQRCVEQLSVFHPEFSEFFVGLLPEWFLQLQRTYALFYWQIFPQLMEHWQRCSTAWNPALESQITLRISISPHILCLHNQQTLELLCLAEPHSALPNQSIGSGTGQAFCALMFMNTTSVHPFDFETASSFHAAGCWNLQTVLTAQLAANRFHDRHFWLYCKVSFFTRKWTVVNDILIPWALTPRH